ncbi:hypothetical protein [Flavobacterium psychraquaticum]|uniref:hypothetical protein n=1 Tax=Flavobacterium psychraquaticum TaxID=3103958 RepID=UPI002ACD2992|nr:hypothetical protein [Flavobacterium sp. LB-N7T]
MKKRVSAELISIAHRILKLKNHADTIQLQLEAKNLYDQLTVLRFYEENFELVKNEIPQVVLEEKLQAKPLAIAETPIEVVEDHKGDEVELMPTPVFTEPIAEEKVVVGELIVEDEDEILEEAELVPTEKEPLAEEFVAEMEPIEVVNEEIEAEEIAPEEVVAQEIGVEIPVETVSSVVGTQAKQISFEDLLVHDYAEMSFVKVEDVPVEVEIANEAVFEPVVPAQEDVATEITPQVVAVFESPKVLEQEVKKTVEKVQESKISSLNDRLNKSIAFGLNDRIGFEKKLFGGSSDDFNRVISQLNTFDNFDEAQSFVQDFVKPDYNNWEGKEEFETRFMEIVEKKFS